MIVQAIGLLDDLDKELNTYAMRVREWYGWHFPEMTKIITDNIVYAKVVCSFPFLLQQLTTLCRLHFYLIKIIWTHVCKFQVARVNAQKGLTQTSGVAQIKLMGTRENAVDKDFSGIPLEEEVEEELKETAIISMGTEISPVDLLNIMSLCDQVYSPASIPRLVACQVQDAACQMGLHLEKTSYRCRSALIQVVMLCNGAR